VAGGYYAVGDVDNNGAQDLVVWDASGLRVFQNTAGVFKAAVVSAVLNARAVELFLKARGSFTLADLDSDGDLDVVFNYEDEGENPGHIAQFTNGATLDGVSGRRVWMAADGFSGVQDVMTVPWRKPHFSVTDSNADGLSDLVVLETNGSWPSDTHVSHKVHVYLNRIGGTGAAGGFGVTTVGDSAFVSFPHDALLNTGTQATIEAWVRGTAVASADDARVTRYSDGKEHKELVVFGDGSVSATYAWGVWPAVKAPAGDQRPRPPASEAGQQGRHEGEGGGGLGARAGCCAGWSAGAGVCGVGGRFAGCGSAFRIIDAAGGDAAGGGCCGGGGSGSD
jgi:hypothetical protein